MDSDRLYLDFNATSPLSQSVQNWLESGEVLFANPSSQHSYGKAARKTINEARASLYATFNLKERTHHLLFHSGATEGMCTFAYSFSEWARLTGKELLICFSKLDHPAVVGLQERYLGPHVKFHELSQDQNLAYTHDKNYEVIKDRKDNNPDLIILYHHLWVHNETGIVSPLEELAVFKNIPDLYLHVDAVQAPGKIPEWKELKIADIFTFSGHKFGAIKGVGLSFFANSISFYPFVTGGGQQKGLRSGTENVMGIKSLELAIGDLNNLDIKRCLKLREEFENYLEQELKGIGKIISSRSSKRNSNTVYFYIEKLTSDTSLALFDLNGIMLSAGSACSSGAAKNSTLLLHLGLKDVARNGLRISFSPSSSEKDLEAVRARFSSVLERIRHFKP